MRLDPPGHARRHADTRRAAGLGQLPGRAIAVRAEIEIVGGREVVGRLGRVDDARADAGEAERSPRLPQVTPADEIPLAGDQLEAVGIDGALQLFVAADRVVREVDRLALGDRRLQLGQHGCSRLRLGDHRQRCGVGVGEQLGAPLGQAEERQTQRLRVGEAVLEDGKAGGQRRQLVRCQLYGRQVVRAGGEAVRLARTRLGVGVGFDLYAEPGQLGAVLVEAALEGLLRHRRIAFDAAADLRDAHGLAAAAEQQRDQGEPAHELVGILAEAFLADPLAAHVRRSGQK